MISNKPIVSIILPVYNAEKYIEKCLKHLLNQTLLNIEILCINDGSKDNSKKILEDYALKDSRLKIFNQENAGPATSRNVGLKNANGKYIMFCDSDDWYETNMCELMIKTIEENNVDFAICDANLIIEKGHNRNSGAINSHKLKTLGLINLNRKNARSSIFVVLWNKIFKKEIIDKYNITFPDGYEYDDNAFIYQYISASNTCFGLNVKLYNYIFRPNSIMGNLNHKNKFTHTIGSLVHTLTSLNKNNHSKDNEYIENFCIQQLVWVSKYLDEEDKIKFWTLYKNQILKLLPPEIVNKNVVFHNVNTSSFSSVNKCLQLLTVKKKFLGITYYKRNHQLTKHSIYILGAQIFKKTEGDLYTSYSYLGIPLLKRENSISNNKLYVLGIPFEKKTKFNK